MKVVLLLLFAGFSTLQYTDGTPLTKDVLIKQKKIITLFYKINQPSNQPEHLEILKSFIPLDHPDSFKLPEVVTNYTLLYEDGLLPRAHAFSIYYKPHLREAIALFRLFYYAKDWDTFFKTAVWARQNVNEALFVYALAVDVIHDPKLVGIVLPPIYEIYPHYFFSSDVINRAYYYKQIHQVKGPNNHDDHIHTIDSNYSGHYLNLHPEQSLSYWLEDIEINAQNFYFHINYPFWMSSQEFGWKNTRRGELFLAIYHKILSRYYLERIANGFGEIPFVDYDGFVETPYVPSLIYSNGLEFPSRPAFARLDDYFYNYGMKRAAREYSYSKLYLRDYDRRINDAIDLEVVWDEHLGKRVPFTPHNANEILGNLLEGNADSSSLSYYGNVLQVARHLFGYAPQSLDDHHVTPSALEHQETSLRDPVFYQIFKRILLKSHRYLNKLPSYTKEELILPGVDIKKVELDDLVTYDDYFYSELTNAVYYGEEEKTDSFKIRVRQSRLNHKPFTIKINVHSDKAQRVSVKLFIAPRDDEYGRYINLTDNVFNMVLIEHTFFDLKVGDNVIVRNSQDLHFFGPDRTSSADLWKLINSAIDDKAEFTVDDRQNYFLWPQRYLLPTGTKEGLPVRFYVFIYPHTKVETEYVHRPGRKDIFVDDAPIYYPFDRLIRHKKIFLHLPNIHSHDVLVYHKDIQDINSPHHH